MEPSSYEGVSPYSTKPVVSSLVCQLTVAEVTPTATLTLLICGGDESSSKLAVTLVSLPTVNTNGLVVTFSGAPQPRNAAPESGSAVSVTSSPQL